MKKFRSSQAAILVLNVKQFFPVNLDRIYNYTCDYYFLTSSKALKTVKFRKVGRKD